MTIKTVAVIGAGSGGLAAVKELKEKGFDVMAFDRCGSVGGRFSLEGDRGIWKTMCSNDDRRSFPYSDFPFEVPQSKQSELGAFPHCTEMKAYFEAYAKHFGLMNSIQLNTEVTSIELNWEDQTWKICTKQHGKESTHTFDGLVVCTGLHCKPRNPLKDTILKDFKGEIIHSSQFHDGAAYNGKKVLLVGSSVSAWEAASAIADFGKPAVLHNSVRRLPYHMCKRAFDGSTLSTKLFVRLPAWLGRFLPASVVTQGLKATILENFPHQQVNPELANGRSPDPDIRVASVTPTVSYVDNLRKGNIIMQMPVEKAEGKTVTFSDGTSHDYDIIICGTGYEADLSFLPKEVQEKVCYKQPFTGAAQVKLYKNTLSPDFPTLAFGGIVENIGPHPPIAEMQARLIAAKWTGKLPRLTRAKLQAGVDAFCAYRESHIFCRYDPNPDLCESIGDDLGLTPSYFQALRNPSALLFGPLYSVYYRTNPKVEGEEKAAKFKAIFDSYMANPIKCV